MNADPRVAFVANRPVAARQQQRRALHGDGDYIVDAPVELRSQIKQASMTA